MIPTIETDGPLPDSITVDGVTHVRSGFVVDGVVYLPPAMDMSKLTERILDNLRQQSEMQAWKPSF